MPKQNPQPQPQPAIIEVTYQEGENSIGFSLHGSVEWLNRMEAIVNYNAAFLLANVKLDADHLATGRNELAAAYEAMQQRKPFNGQFVKFTPSQEGK